MRATAPARASEGWSFLYDPSGEVECPPGVERVGWSPITTASDWDAAVVTADAMVGASRLSGQRGGEHHWTERAGALLSTLLHAAATEELSMRDVLKWIDRHNGARPSKFSPRTPGRTLRRPICSPGSSPRIPVSSQVSGPPHRASWPRTAPRARSHPPSAPPLDLEEFCGGANTLYVCSTGRRQRQFAPLVVAIVGDVRDAAYVRSRDGQAGPPTLLALDEVANIAPIPDLPAMVSEGAGQGLLVLACLQDLSQARVRWGPAADGFLSLFGTTVVLRGIADTATLRDISALAGDREVAATTISRSVDRWGRLRPSTSVGSTRQARLPVDAVAHGAPGRAWSLARTRRCTRSRSPRRTSAHPGVSSSAGAPARPAVRPTAAADSASAAPSTGAGSRHPSRARAAASSRSVRMWSARRPRRQGGQVRRLAERAPRRGPRPHLSR